MAGIIFFYAKYNPEGGGGIPFPKCGFYVLTGYKCPGCGTQRALHQFLNGHFLEALKQNFLLFLAIPFTIMVILTNKSKKFVEHYPRLTSFFNGYRSTLIAVIAIFAFWILRNIFGF